MKSWFLLFVMLLLLACEGSVPPGQIRVKNDCQDSTYNVISVSGGGAHKSLKPGEAVLLPKRTTSITLSRQYKDYTRVYKIECPYNKDQGILVKMIDAHLNRMRGGCKTVYASKN